MTAQTFELNHCYNMDCMEAMAAFPNDYFDLAVVDPPYFSGPERRGFYGSKVSRIGVHRDYPVSPAWEVPGKEYFDELTRVSRHYIIWGCNYFSYGFAPGRIVWDKCNQATSFSDCEIAATDLLKTIRLFRYMWSGSDMRAQGAACFRFPIINRRAGSMPAVRTRKEDNYGNQMLDPGLPAGKTGIRCGRRSSFADAHRQHHAVAGHSGSRGGGTAA